MQQLSSAGGTHDVDRSCALAVVHRNRLLRDCLARVLSERGSVPAESIDHSSLSNLQVLTQRPFGLVLVDLNLAEKSGLELVRQLRHASPSTKIIALVSTAQADQVVQGFELGVQSFITEESSIDEFVRAIEAVLSGQTFCSAELVQMALARMTQSAKPQPWCVGNQVRLTAREREILALIGEHLSNKQIAKRLSVSLYTVKNHVHNILEKLQVDSRFGAVEYARHFSPPRGQQLLNSATGV